MPKLFARSVTPRAAGIVLLLAAAVAAVLIPATGGLTSAAPRTQPRLESPEGGQSASAGAASSDVLALGGGHPIVSAAVHHDVSPPLRAMRAAPSKLKGPHL